MSANAAAAGHHEHHGPAPSTFHPYRTGLNPAVLGLIMFLVSEAALFGSFFMYYGHQRLIRGVEWPAPGLEIPANSTSINTAILVASSFTCEFAIWSLMKGKRKIEPTLLDDEARDEEPGDEEEPEEDEDIEEDEEEDD